MVKRYFLIRFWWCWWCRSESFSLHGTHVAAGVAFTPLRVSTSVVFGDHRYRIPGRTANLQPLTFLGILVRMDRLDDHHTNVPRGRIFGNFHVEVCVFLGGWTTSKKATSNKEDSWLLGGQTTSNVCIVQQPNKNTGSNRKNWGHYKFTLFYLKHSWKTNASVCLQLQLVTFLPDLVKVCYSSTENWPWQSSPVQKRCLSHALRNG